MEDWEIQFRQEFSSKPLLLGADHLTFEGVGGGVGDFEKKFPTSACRKKKIACSLYNKWLQLHRDFVKLSE